MDTDENKDVDKSAATLALVKKGKDCVAIAETISSDITKGSMEGVEQKLKGLERDAEELGKHTEERAKEAEKREERCEYETKEIQRKIGKSELEKENLEQNKPGLEATLAQKQQKRDQVSNELSAAEGQLKGAKNDVERARRQQAKHVGGGATFGAMIGTLIFPGVGTALGAAAGAGAGLAVNDNAIKEAQNIVDKCKGRYDYAQTEVSSANRAIDDVRSRINDLSAQCQNLERELQRYHEKADKVKNAKAFFGKAAHFWKEFRDISEHGAKRTIKLQNIISKAKEEEDLSWLDCSLGEKIVKPFLDAWEMIEMKWEQSTEFTM